MFALSAVAQPSQAASANEKLQGVAPLHRRQQGRSHRRGPVDLLRGHFTLSTPMDRDCRPATGPPCGPVMSGSRSDRPSPRPARHRAARWHVRRTTPPSHRTSRHDDVAVVTVSRPVVQATARDEHELGRPRSREQRRWQIGPTALPARSHDVVVSCTGGVKHHDALAGAYPQQGAPPRHQPRESESRRSVTVMSYPGRPVLEVLPQFAGTATIKQSPQQRAALLEFVAENYSAGRSLRELGELTGRSQTAIRRALDAAGVLRRAPGAPSTASAGGRADALQPPR